MSRLTSMTVRNYRAFRGPVQLELRPLTLLYGRNNVGKSTLVRLPVLVAESVQENLADPINLSGIVSRGATFRSLLHESDLRSFQLLLGWSDGLSAEYTLKMDRDGIGEVVMLVVDCEPDNERFVWAHPTRSEPDQVPADATMDNRDFLGLVPVGSDVVIDRLAKALLALKKQVSWLSALRRIPSSITERRSMPLGPEGQGALENLLLRPRLLSEVNDWTERVMGRTLRWQEIPTNRVRWLFPPTSNPNQDIELFDSGEGVLQVLPVLTALAMRGERESQIIALEEPTTHLHDDLQIHLTDRLCEVVSEPDSPSLLVETHSRPVLLATQLALAESRLRPQDVILYWIDQDEDGVSRMEPVTFSADGHPESDKLLHIFGDEPDVARRLARRWTP